MALRDGLTGGVRRADVLLAAGVLAVSLVQVLVQPIETPWIPGSRWFGPVLAAVLVLPLAWRRARPVAAAFVGAGLWWVPTDGFLYLGYVTAVLLFFAVGRRGGSGRPALAVTVWALASGTAGILAIEQADDRLVPLVFDVDLREQVAALRLPRSDALLSIAGFWLVILVPYGLGRLMAAQQRESDERVVAEREAARRSAVEQERARIVRELHDVVGHEVTLMSIQSEAATQALQLAPERAAGPIEAVRETAHRASRELRAILDLLGDGDLPVVPDERGLQELADRAARLGIANRLTVVGAPWTDAPRHWLAVNRIVQECLTNAGRHAAGEKVDLHLEWSAAGVRVRATNPAPARTPGAPRPDLGRGLPGMEERARSLGGTLDAAHVDGRFEVTAWLPAQEGPR